MENGVNQRGKMLGIELMRFLSAVAVLIFHYKNFTYFGLSQVDGRNTNFPFQEILWPLYKYGDYGVQVFWVLSGFIFFWKYREAVANGLIGGGSFLILRFSRLYPLHLLTLIFVALLQIAYTHVRGEPFACDGNDWFHFVLHLFMASNWRGQWGLSFNAPIWSVSVEVLIYALFFVLLRVGFKSWWSCAVIVGAGILARNGGADNRVVACASFFFAGGLVAVLDQKIVRSARERMFHSLMLVLVAVLPLIYGFVFFHAGHGNAELLFLNLWVPVLVLCIVRIRVNEKGRIAQWLEIGGNVTYASYLLHFPIQIAVALLFARQAMPVPYESPVLLISYISAVLILSVWVYRNFEVIVQRRIRRYLLAV